MRQRDEHLHVPRRCSAEKGRQLDDGFWHCPGERLVVRLAGGIEDNAGNCGQSLALVRGNIRRDPGSRDGEGPRVSLYEIDRLVSGQLIGQSIGNQRESLFPLLNDRWRQRAESRVRKSAWTAASMGAAGAVERASAGVSAGSRNAAATSW